jgi:hypothetical protein
MASKASENVIFKSKTRLYTNFHSGEHNEKYVIQTAKNMMGELIETFPATLSEDLFIEGILSGGANTQAKTISNKTPVWDVDISNLKEDYVKWLLKLFKSPKSFFKKMTAMIDGDGSLCFDVDIQVKINADLYSEIAGERCTIENFKEKRTKLHALYNTISAVKYLLFYRFVRTLKITPGVDVDDICDVYELEYIANPLQSEISKYTVAIKSSSNKYTKLWEIPMSKIL